MAQVHRDSVNPHLPPGYTAKGTNNNPHIIAVACANATLEGRSLGPFSLAWSGTLLAEANGNETEGGVDFYRFEWFVDGDAVLLDWMHSMNWPGMPATITVENAGFSVVADQIRYEVEGTDDVFDGGQTSGPNRVHHGSGQPSWFIEHERVADPWTTGGLLSAEGGVFEHFGVGPMPLDPYPGTLVRYFVDMTISLDDSPRVV